MAPFDRNILGKSPDACSEYSVAFLQLAGAGLGCLLDDAGEVVAEDERRVNVAFFGVHVLVGALCVENVGVLGATVGYADEVFVGFGVW